jgi:hypothetical protein
MAPRFGRNPLGRLTDYFDVADHGILQFLRRHKRLSAGSDEANDAMAPLQHVVKIQAVILHRGVASRRIRSRAYQ